MSIFFLTHEFAADKQPEFREWFQCNIGDGVLKAEFPLGELDVSVRRSNGQEISGLVESDLVDRDELISRATFLVVNGPKMNGRPIQRGKASFRGRCAVELDEVSIIVDALSAERERRPAYSITQVAQLSFVRPIAAKEIAPYADTLFRTLSMIRCRWVGLIGPWLHSCDGQLISVVPAVTRTERHGNTMSWCHEQLPEAFSELFLRLHSGFKDSRLAEALTTGIHWLIEAELCAGDVEGAVVLQQAALESIAWYEIVQRRELCSAQGFEKLPVSDKLRWLASLYRIPISIPEKCTHIAAYAAELLDRRDLPEVLVHVRNALAHGTPKKVEKLFGRKRGADEPTELWHQIGSVLSQTVLAISGYQGCILRRDLDVEYATSAMTDVPWADKIEKRSFRFIMSQTGCGIEHTTKPITVRQFHRNLHHRSQDNEKSPVLIYQYDLPRYRLNDFQRIGVSVPTKRHSIRRKGCWMASIYDAGRALAP